MAAADLLGGEQPVVAMVGRHADVDDRDVGPARLDHAQQRVGVAAAPGDLEAGVLEQAGEALAQEHLVVGDHDRMAAPRGAWLASAVSGPADGADAILDADRQRRRRRGRAQLDDSRSPSRWASDVDARRRRQPQRLARRGSRRPTRRRRAALAGQRAEHEPRLVLGERVDRGGEALLGEHRREEPVGELAQLGHRRAQLSLGGGELRVQRGVAGGVPAPSEADADRERHEALLGAVVEVALEPPALAVGGRDDPRARGAQLVELGAPRACRRSCSSASRAAAGDLGDQRRVVEQAAAVDDGGDAAAAADERVTSRSGAGGDASRGPSASIHAAVDGRGRARARGRRASVGEQPAQPPGRRRGAEVDHEPGERRRARRARDRPHADARRDEGQRGDLRRPTARGRSGRWRGSRVRPCALGRRTAPPRRRPGTSTGAATPAARGRGARSRATRARRTPPSRRR